jgi:hypothetical protein
MALVTNVETTDRIRTHQTPRTRRATHWSLVRLSVVAMMSTVLALCFAAPAFASGPRASTKVPGSAVPIGKYTSGTPFSSGQVIAVKIPPNSTLTPGAGIKILECSAPGGAVPTDPSQCDGETVQGDTVLVNKDGSVDYTHTRIDSGYTVYALPDFHSLGESKHGLPVCNATHLCVLYIGQNQLDFTVPHYWSQPFEVTPTPGDTGARPGDGARNPTQGANSSNALLTIVLPIVVVLVVGGSFVFLRRRRKSAQGGAHRQSRSKTSHAATGSR